jgi:cysteine desulfurase
MAHYATLGKMRDALEAHMIDFASHASACERGAVKLYGEAAPRVGNTINIGLNGVPAQTQMMALDLDGIAVSSGSACSSGSFKPSHVLTAMGADEEAAKCALRISMGWNTTQEELDRFFESWKKIAQRHK